MAHDLVEARQPSSLLTDHLSVVIKFTSFTSKVRVGGTALGAVAETTVNSALYTIQYNSAGLQIDNLASSTCTLQWDLAKPRNCWKIILAPLNYTVKEGNR